MSVLKVYRSSAGAGKTYTLVYEYLRLALKHPEAFAHILAVTFTNKATQEMKQRVLASLHDLSQGSPVSSSLATALLQETQWEEDTLQNRAKDVLSSILHQYTRFSVSTIDSLFQKIVRGFAYELGLPHSFRVSVDQEEVLEALVDDFTRTVNQHPWMQHWLIAFAEDKLLTGKSWNLKQELMTLSRELLGEAFGAHEAQLMPLLGDTDTLEDFLKSLHQSIRHFEHTLQRLGQQATQAIRREGLVAGDFSYGTAGVAGYLTGLAEKRKWRPSSRVLRALEQEKAWYKSTSDEHKQMRMHRVVQEVLRPCLQDTVQYYNTHHRAYYSALEIRHSIYAFGATTHLLDKLRDYRAQHNLMLVSDPTLLLRKIVADNDTPFVYEKIGAFYRHFLVDEFQDVSRFQWYNLKPLLVNSLHEGHASLVVGDVKQSIYRWRGGDWRLLMTELAQELPATHSEVLATNWRSRQHIVDFNNFFFTHAASTLVQHFKDDLASLEDDTLREKLMVQADRLGDVYQDARQHLPSPLLPRHKGHVHITLLKHAAAGTSPQAWREIVHEKLPLRIESLQRDGFSLKDIALLVRSNAEGRAIFQSLLSYQRSARAKKGYRYDVVSQESLYISRSPWVNILLNAMRCLVEPGDTLAQAELSYLYQVHVLHVPSDSLHACFQVKKEYAGLPLAFVQRRRYLQQLPLYELVEVLIAVFKLHQVSEATVFLQALQDSVLTFLRKEEGADVTQFLAWWYTQGVRTTLSRAAEQDAMTLMTIHQAKGLQFKVVIVPFCAWDLDHNVYHPPTLWCSSDVAPFSQFPALPVRYGSRLKDTVYAKVYYEEQMQAYLDHLNLLYVAFTRPEDRLYVFAPHPTQNALKTTADLLYQILTANLEPAHMPRSWEGIWDESEGTFEMGAAEP